MKLLSLLTFLFLLAGALMGCGQGTGGTVPSSPTATSPQPSQQSVTLDITAKGFKFDKGTITVPAGASVTINFTNQDSGTPHNVAVYTDSSASKSIFVGTVITGSATTVYKFTAPSTPGKYFFRCDIHPAAMTGDFIVTASP